VLMDDMKIYVETSCLRSNIRHPDPKSQKELAALEQLAERYSLFGSRLTLREAMATAKKTQQDSLILDYKALQPIPKDERLLGFNSQSDRYGGFISYPLIADCQDETLRKELMEYGLEPKDAEHLTQAICNDCEVFLTRDEATIIHPHRQWLEQRFPNLKIRLPSELLNELASVPPGS
jgi:predicted nucleic acid-binding protein